MNVKLKSRCVMIAACNPSNMKKLDNNKEFEDKDVEFNIEPALLSRFDTVFILRNQFNYDFERDSIRHSHAWQSGKIDKNKYLTMGQLKRHFLAVKDIKPTVTKNAEIIMKEYYNRICQNDSINKCRLSMRCLEGLYRLSFAYCRLLLKSKVTELDVIVVIRLIMENSYSMGTVINPQMHLIHQKLPLGPTEEEIKIILTTLELENMFPIVQKQLDIALGNAEAASVDLLTNDTPNITEQSPTIWDEFVMSYTHVQSASTFLSEVVSFEINGQTNVNERTH